MSRAYRFAVIGIIWMLAIVCHWFATLVFVPESGNIAYDLAQPAVGTFIDAGYTKQHYKIFAQYIPLLFMGFSLLWGFASEYEEQVLTGRRRR